MNLLYNWWIKKQKEIILFKKWNNLFRISNNATLFILINLYYTLSTLYLISLINIANILLLSILILFAIIIRLLTTDDWLSE